METSIYRKPTFTDTIIPYTSNHPTQHKYTAVKFLYNRLNSYYLHKKKYQQVVNISHNILHNNFFPIRPLNPPIFMPKQQRDLPTPKHRWATFTYISKETAYVTNIFRRSDLRIAYCTNNTIHNHLIHKDWISDKFSLSGVYKITCPDCMKAYVGQTGRSFIIKYNEHKLAFRNNSHTSRIAQHLSEHAHSFSTISNTMQVLH